MGFDHQQPQGLQQPLLADPQPTAPPLAQAHGAALVGPGGAAYAVSPGPYPPYDNTHAPAVGGGECCVCEFLCVPHKGAGLERPSRKE
jgi:hypothetical protein